MIQGLEFRKKETIWWVKSRREEMRDEAKEVMGWFLKDLSGYGKKTSV